MKKLTKEPNIVELKETYKQMKKTFFNWEKLKNIIKRDIKHNIEEYDESFISAFQNYWTIENWILDIMEDLEKAD